MRASRIGSLSRPLTVSAQTGRPGASTHTLARIYGVDSALFHRCRERRSGFVNGRERLRKSYKIDKTVADLH